MSVFRLLLLCLTLAATAAMPSRAASICPTAAPQGAMQAPMPCADHANAPERHKGCPAVMACCVPPAVPVSATALVLPQAWRLLVRTPLVSERERDGATPDSLLRPPRTA